jgi:steroid 5-alpha reductase family enzyme
MLIAAAILFVLFIATWWLSVRVDNYSLVDVTWSLSFAPVALWYGFSGTGWQPRRYLVAGLVTLWSLRLGFYLWKRVASHHPKEDARYAVLRQDWGPNLPRVFLGFFLGQGVLVWLLMLPVLLLCQSPAEGFGWLEVVGASVWAIGIVGEGVSDSQLKRFKAAGHPRGAICQEGLWYYSRHPNYFFQSLLWWGLFLMALTTPWGWIAILAPLSMLYFLLRVTGIPLTEQLAVASRGDSYREYQRTTSAFVPLPRRA